MSKIKDSSGSETGEIDKVIRISPEAYRKLQQRSKQIGLPIRKLADLAVDEADDQWNQKGIHIPPARV